VTDPTAENLEHALNVVLEFVGGRRLPKLPGLIAEALLQAAARDLASQRTDDPTAEELALAIETNRRGLLVMREIDPEMARLIEVLLPPAERELARLRDPTAGAPSDCPACHGIGGDPYETGDPCRYCCGTGTGDEKAGAPSEAVAILRECIGNMGTEVCAHAALDEIEAFIKAVSR
jgi:hypothetical protein